MLARFPLIFDSIAFLAEFRSDESPAAPFDPSINRKPASASSSAPPSGMTTPKPPFNNSAHTLMPSSPSLLTPAAPGPLSPTPIHDALRHNPRFEAMRRGTQEDAEEFLGFFLETLHEEILKLVEFEEAQKEKRKGKGKAPATGATEEGWEEVGSKGRVATTRTVSLGFFHREARVVCSPSGRFSSCIDRHEGKPDHAHLRRQAAERVAVSWSERQCHNRAVPATTARYPGKSRAAAVSLRCGPS